MGIGMERGSPLASRTALGAWLGRASSVQNVLAGQLGLRLLDKLSVNNKCALALQCTIDGLVGTGRKSLSDIRHRALSTQTCGNLLRCSRNSNNSARSVSNYGPASDQRYPATATYSVGCQRCCSQLAAFRRS